MKAVSLRQRINEQSISRCSDLRRAGFTWPACGEMLGLNGESLRSAFLRKSLPKSAALPPLSPVDPKMVLRARELRAAGMRWKLIERELGVAWQPLSRFIHIENKRAKNGQQ